MRNRLLKALANDTLSASPPASGGSLILPKPGRLCRLLLGGGGPLLGLALLGRLPGRDLDDLDLSPGLLDLLTRLAAHLVRAHGDGLGEVAVAEDLESAARHLDRARLLQGLDRDRALEPQPIQVAHVDDGVLHPEGVGEAAFRDAALDRHLAALEAEAA